MNKKKVYFILSHLGAGGSERVFWILSQYFNKSVYEVSLVLLDARNPFFSTDIEGVNIINLNSIRASHSFFKLYKLIKEEKPFAVFTTGGHINTLLSFVSLFVDIPTLIGRESNVMDVMTKMGGFKEKFWDLFVGITYKRFNIAVCQSLEIKYSLVNHYQIPKRKLVVIPNPVLSIDIPAINLPKEGKKIILVARLAVEKGILRLLQIFKNLPEEYTLTIAGDGPLKKEILKEIIHQQLHKRVQLVGVVNNITKLMASHHLLVLPSVTEGFPNVVLESLSVGTPVVAFRVSGVQAIINSNFNGYIIDQGDLNSFEKHIIKACNQNWDHQAIKEDVNTRFSVQKVVKQYETLLSYR
jgi:glycosyltransferase involved in cell wall biosynthesis